MESMELELNMQRLGAKIKALREGASLTEVHIADYLGISQSLVCKFENGEDSLSSEMIDKLSALFCCELSALLFNREPQPAFNIMLGTDLTESEAMITLSAINRIALNRMEMARLSKEVVKE